MSSGRSLALSVFITVVLLVFASVSAEAAGTSHSSTSGTASSGGKNTITIETFGKPGYPGEGGPGIESQTTTVSCTIAAGMTAAQTSIALRDSLNAQLPGGLGYTASIVGGCTTIVTLYNNRAPFNMNISSTVGGQTTSRVSTNPCWTEPSGPIPTLSEWGLIILTAALVVAGALFLRRRRAAGSPA